VIWDHFTNPQARSVDDVPWSADGITSQWLTSVLCKLRPGSEVLSFTISRRGAGTSVRWHIALQYNEEGKKAKLPEALFAKTTPTLFTRLTTSEPAWRESCFYEQIRPSLRIETPLLFASAHDRNSGRSINLLEDIVASKQAQFCNYATTVSRQQAENMVDLLASFHAAFYDSPRFNNDLAWLPKFEDILLTGERNGIVVGHEQAMHEAASVIPPDVIARKSEIWPMTLLSLGTHEHEPRTLSHSDVHLGNWYFTGKGEMGLCDWQMVCKGHWSRDFAYAISSSLTIPNRRAWEHDLLKRYLERMREFGGVNIAFDDAWKHYRQQIFAALLMWTPTLCHPPTMPDMQPLDMSLEMIKRITAAISDLESFDSQ